MDLYAEVLLVSAPTQYGAQDVSTKLLVYNFTHVPCGRIVATWHPRCGQHDVHMLCHQLLLMRSGYGGRVCGMGVSSGRTSGQQ